MPPSIPTTGLVLAGAVAKGAYYSGLLSVLAERRIVPRRIVGTSSGALCATVFAAGVATGRVPLAARIIEDNWRNHASLWDAAQFSLSDTVHLRGVATVEKLRTRLLSSIEQVLQSTDPGEVWEPFPEVEFSLIATDLAGLVPTGDDTLEQVTHERAFSFRGSDFGSPSACEEIALATAASAAFPGLFAPVAFNGRYLIDGGATNNSPISYVIQPPEVDRVIVSTAAGPGNVTFKAPPHGVGLVSELVDILIDERLWRDLRAAYRANARVERVVATMKAEGLSDAQQAAVLRSLGLRPIEVLEVRPLSELEGNPFSGFFSSALRASYVDAGKERARAVLGP